MPLRDRIKAELLSKESAGKTVKLANCWLKDAELEELVELIEENSSIKSVSLDVGNSTITKKGFSSIASIHCLTHLNLEQTGLGDKSLLKILEQNAKLVSIKISTNSQLTDTSGKVLLNKLKDSDCPLKSVALNEQCQISHELQFHIQQANVGKFNVQYPGYQPPIIDLGLCLGFDSVLGYARMNEEAYLKKSETKSHSQETPKKTNYYPSFQRRQS